MHLTIDELLGRRRAFGAMLCCLRTSIKLRQVDFVLRVPGMTRNRLTCIERGAAVPLPEESARINDRLLREIETTLKTAVPPPARVPAGLVPSRKPIRLPFRDDDFEAVAADCGRRRAWR